MAKQGQHNDDAHDYDKSRGHNNPAHSQTIVTGSYKKQETYKKQAAEHKDTGKLWNRLIGVRDPARLDQETSR